MLSMSSFYLLSSRRNNFLFTLARVSLYILHHNSHVMRCINATRNDLLPTISPSPPSWYQRILLIIEMISSQDQLDVASWPQSTKWKNGRNEWPKCITYRKCKSQKKSVSFPIKHPNALYQCIICERTHISMPSPCSQNPYSIVNKQYLSYCEQKRWLISL